MKNAKPPLENWYPTFLAIFVGFVVADLVVLGIRSAAISTIAPPAKPQSHLARNMTAPGAYNTLTARNIFDSTGNIPDALRGEGDNGTQKEAEPVPSSLPLALVGTIVHSNPAKSVATIDVKGKNQVLSFGVNQEIDGIATLIRVERQKAVIRNLNNNRLEFIEIKSGNKIAFGLGAGTQPSGSSEVTQIAPNTFAIKRTDLSRYTNNMQDVLQQARALPNRDPSTGEINGYRLVDIKPDSIFSQLGLQKMDVILGVNGERVDSPQKAMESYNALKNSSSIKIDIERNGHKETLNYSITK